MINKMKKLTMGLMALLVVYTIMNPALAQETTRVTIGTAGTSGALYPMGVAMAETINRHVPNIRASAEATGGSLVNLRHLAQGDTEWGISASEVAYQAYMGEGAYKGRAVDSLQSLFGTVVSWTQIFAAADSSLSSVADFKGKRIGVGPPGSSGEQTARKLLAHFGMSYDDIREEFMTNSDMVAALQDGMLDAFIITHPLRSATLMDLTTGFKVKLISVKDDDFYEQYPFFEKSEIPAGTYSGVVEPAYTPTSRIVMYTSKKAHLSEEQIYNMLKAIWENRSEWADVHAAVQRTTSLENALDGLSGVPLHPGAIKYYREQGLEVPQGMQ